MANRGRVFLTDHLQRPVSASLLGTEDCERLVDGSQWCYRVGPIVRTRNVVVAIVLDVSLNGAIGIVLQELI